MRKIKISNVFHTALALICLLILGCVFSMTVQAEEKTNADTGYRMVFNDEEKLIEDSAQIMEKMQEITDYSNAAFVSAANAAGESTASLAKEYYREYFGTDNGVLFIIDMGNRQLYIFSDGYAYKAIGKKGSYSITDNIYTYATDGDYDSCVMKGFEQIETMLEGGHVLAPMRYICAAFFALGLALLVTFIWAKFSSVRSAASNFEYYSSVKSERELANMKKTLLRRELCNMHYASDSSSSSGSGGGGGGGSSGGGGGHGF